LVELGNQSSLLAIRTGESLTHGPNHLFIPVFIALSALVIMSQTHGAPGVCVDCNNPNQSSAVAKPESGKAVTEENPLDAATFVPPIPHPYPSIIIEFCDRVRTIDSALDPLN